MTSIGAKQSRSVDASNLSQCCAADASLRLLDLRPRRSRERPYRRIGQYPLDQFMPYCGKSRAGLNGDPLVVLREESRDLGGPENVLQRSGVHLPGFPAAVSTPGLMPAGRRSIAAKGAMERLTAGTLVIASIFGSLVYPKLRFLSAGLGLAPAGVGVSVCPPRPHLSVMSRMVSHRSLVTTSSYGTCPGA